MRAVHGCVWQLFLVAPAANLLGSPVLTESSQAPQPGVQGPAASFIFPYCTLSPEASLPDLTHSASPGDFAQGEPSL